MSRLSLIVARARNGAIGLEGKMPWHLPQDLAHFKRSTLGHPIIMGRKTWESIGRPLPGRRNIVVTRNADYAAPGAEVASSLADALAKVAELDEVFVIGGGELYTLALPLAQRLVVTEIEAEFAGDAFFPEFSKSEWRETGREDHAPSAEQALGYAFVTYERIAPLASD